MFKTTDCLARWRFIVLVLRVGDFNSDWLLASFGRPSLGCLCASSRRSRLPLRPIACCRGRPAATTLLWNRNFFFLGVLNQISIAMNPPLNSKWCVYRAAIHRRTVIHVPSPSDRQELIIPDVLGLSDQLGVPGHVPQNRFVLFLIAHASLVRCGRIKEIHSGQHNPFELCRAGSAVCILNVRDKSGVRGTVRKDGILRRVRQGIDTFGPLDGGCLVRIAEGRMRSV